MEAEGITADYFPESQLSAVINWPKVSLFFCSVILMGSTLCTSNTVYMEVFSPFAPIVNCIQYTVSKCRELVLL